MAMERVNLIVGIPDRVDGVDYMELELEVDSVSKKIRLIDQSVLTLGEVIRKANPRESNESD